MARYQAIAVAIGIAALLAGPVMAQVAPSPGQNQNFERDETKLKPGANSFAEGQARQLLADQGFSNISPLMNDKDGIWHGNAVKDQKTVEVSIDYQGRIAVK